MQVVFSLNKTEHLGTERVKMNERHVSAQAFYDEWHGHHMGQLNKALQYLRCGGNGSRNIIFLAGDSSLDNKYWVAHTKPVPALNGYEHFLRPPLQFRDVAYWINHRLVIEGDQSTTACLNAAIEATTLAERSLKLFVLSMTCHNVFSLNHFNFPATFRYPHSSQFVVCLFILHPFLLATGFLKIF